MSNPQVTIVVSPREHFSFTQVSLESIYAQTRTPFKLIYVDGGSPKHIQKYLVAQAAEKGFRLIRTEHYLAGNQARNMGLREADTKYVAFVDNDVEFLPNWLGHLVRCAEETGAWLVAPIYCLGKTEDLILHRVGGEGHVVEKRAGLSSFFESVPYEDQRLKDILPRLRREPCEVAEFHCMLARTDVFQKIGLLDEKLLGTRDNLDISLTVRRAGGRIYYEPEAIVNQVFPPPFTRTDRHYFLLRWSDEWMRPSLRHFNEKWGINDPDRNEILLNQWLRPRRRVALGRFPDRARRLLGWRIGSWVVEETERFLLRRPLKEWQRAQAQSQAA
jgi:GT2 family glycosyltransferase